MEMGQAQMHSFLPLFLYQYMTSAHPRLSIAAK